MALTGRSDGPPLGPPPPLLRELERLRAELERHASAWGRTINFDPLRIVSDRAALVGLTRRGDVSCGGSTRLLHAADGWVAVSLARAADVDLLPAWLGLDAVPADPWPVVTHMLGELCATDAVARGVMLGLPVAALGEITPTPERPRGVVRTTIARHVRAGRDQLVVVDLSSLWAGPLCTSLLQKFGARVIKVESRHRPDGARATPAFFDHLNAGKEHVALDFGSPADVATLRALLEHADVVVEGSRPRALEQLGICAIDILANGPAVWVSITGYGRTEPQRYRVAFGDDAAVAGGLVVYDERGPCFCADAITDPLTGMVAAVATLDALSDDGAHLVDVAMSSVAASCAARA
jgi:hypothetical protein